LTTLGVMVANWPPLRGAASSPGIKFFA